MLETERTVAPLVASGRCLVVYYEELKLDLEGQLEHRLIDRLLHHLDRRLRLLPVIDHNRDASSHGIHVVLLSARAEAP